MLHLYPVSFSLLQYQCVQGIPQKRSFPERGGEGKLVRLFFPSHLSYFCYLPHNLAFRGFFALQCNNMLYLQAWYFPSKALNFTCNHLHFNVKYSGTSDGNIMWVGFNPSYKVCQICLSALVFNSHVFRFVGKCRKKKDSFPLHSNLLLVCRAVFVCTSCHTEK